MEGQNMLMLMYLDEDGKILCDKQTDIVFSNHYDAVIIGGGTAGSIAALCLSKKGRKVLLVEEQNFLGGIHSDAMFHYYQGSTGGIYEEYDALIEERTKQYRIADTFGSSPIIRMCVYEEELKRDNFTICFNSTLVGVYTESGIIKGIRILTDGVLKSISADCFIDSSGEAVLFQMVGCADRSGRNFDGLSQPFSNVRHYYDVQKNTVTFDNIDAGYIKQNEINEYSDKIVSSLINPTYSQTNNNCITLGMAQLLGTREGYTINGIHRLEFKDILMNRKCVEPLFYSSSNIDNHVKDMAFESQELCDWVVGLSMWSILLCAGIDKEMMIPNEYSNIIAAGRILSLDHDMASHTRMMRDCQKSGEAAAVIVDEALKEECSLAEVPYEPVKEKLTATGCIIKPYAFFKDNPPLDCEPITKFPKSIEEIKNGLKSDRPGLSMLSAWQQNKISNLKSWLQCSNRNLQINSATVLALCGSNLGEDILIDTAQKRDAYIPKTSKSYNSLRGVSAVYALGRVKSIKAIEPLLQMLRNNERMVEDHIVFDKFIGNVQDYRFQYVSHLVRALLDIAVHCKSYQEHIYESIDAVVMKPGFKVSTTLKSNPDCLHDMTGELLSFIHYKKEEAL